MDDKNIVNLTEQVEILNLAEDEKIISDARIDTGAAGSSLDIGLASKLKLGPIVKHSKIRNSHGNSIRLVFEAKIKLGEKLIKEKFNITNRTHMKYPVLIGRNVLKHGFLVNCEGERK